MRAPTIPQINSRLNAVNDSLSNFIGREFTTSVCSEFGMLAARVSMPKNTALNIAERSALERSIQHLLGGSYDLPMLKRNMNRLIANWHYIRDGQAIPEWKGEKIEATALFIGVRRLPVEPGDRPKYEVMLKLKSGIAAGIITCALLTESNIYRFLDKSSGTSDLNCAAEEIAGMEAEVMVEALEGKIRICQWACTQRQKKQNKELALLRSDIRKCKRNIPCNTCRCNIYECSLAVWLPPERR